MNMQATLTPPHSTEAEQAVLGGLMLRNSAWDAVSDKLTQTSFYERTHQLIWSAMAVMLNAASPVDVVTLAEELENQGTLQDAGELSYIGMLARNTPSAANITAYADIVQNHAIRRQLAATAHDIAAQAYEADGATTAQMLDEAEQSILAIANKDAAETEFKSLKSVLPRVIQDIDERFENPNTLSGMDTGFSALNTKTTGFQPADLIIIAARPSMGKTALAMNIAQHVAVSNGKAVAIFSMEMPAKQLTTRLLSSVGLIDSTRLRTGEMMAEDWDTLTVATSKLNKAPLFIDDNAALTVGQIRARARRLHREQKEGLSLIVIDYIQLMQGSGKADNRTTELSEITRGLKALAKELNIPIIALSQLNRSLEQRPNKRPIMSDLRESGAIEQDADVILFIYRDEVYNEETTEKGKAEIIIGKQRNGPIGTINLSWQGQFTRFGNFAYSNEQQGGYQ